MAGCIEHDNEHNDFIKGAEFLNYPSEYMLLKWVPLHIVSRTVSID
jgi:hypothetical protein